MQQSETNQLIGIVQAHYRELRAKAEAQKPRGANYIRQSEIARAIGINHAYLIDLFSRQRKGESLPDLHLNNLDKLRAYASKIQKSKT